MWTQLFVKAPEGNGYTDAKAMKRIDDHLVQMFPASFKAPEGTPIQEADGTWEVRVLDPNAVSIVKSILTGHYGLQIVKEVQQTD